MRKLVLYAIQKHEIYKLWETKQLYIVLVVLYLTCQSLQYFSMAFLV